MALIGGLAIVIGLINSIIGVSSDWTPRIVTLIFAIALIVLSLIFGRSKSSVRIMIWAWVVVTTLFVAKLAFDAASSDSELNLTYPIVLNVLAPTLTMMWSASLVSVIFNAILFVFAAFQFDSQEAIPATVAVITVASVGLVLLQIRMTWADKLTREKLRTQQLATTDATTGVLSREGALLLMPSIVSVIERTEEKMYVFLVDILNMNRLNAEYGFSYGDSVVGAVSRAVKSTMPSGDLLARWNGDCFLVFGTGTQPSSAEFAGQIDQAILNTGITLGKRPVKVSIGTASGMARDSEVSDLIIEATADLERQTESLGKTHL